MGILDRLRPGKAPGADASGRDDQAPDEHATGNGPAVPEAPREAPPSAAAARVEAAPRAQDAPLHPAPVRGDLIVLHDVTKTYHTAAGDFPALRDVSLRLGASEFVAVVGKSGSGKSTLLNMIAGIDRPTEGAVFVDDTAVHDLSEGDLAVWRGRHLGIVFQFFQLLPTLTVVENVMLPMDFGDVYPSGERYDRAMALLDRVEMTEHADKLPSAVSGGQQQRVAIARALANDPPILLADEPTGNLDTKTAEDIFYLFEELVAAGKTILIVTHDLDLAHRVSRTIELQDGRVLSETHNGRRGSPRASELAAGA